MTATAREEARAQRPRGVRMEELPPGPRFRAPGASLQLQRRDPLRLFRGMARRWGDVSSVRIAGFPVVLLNDPELIRDILVTRNKSFHKGPALQEMKIMLGEGLLTSEGEFHLRQRRLAQPAFHRQRIAAYGDTMARQAAELSDAWTDGATLDIAPEMSRLTLGIITETMFGTRQREGAGEVLDALTTAISYFDLLLVPGINLLFRLPLPMVRRFNRAQARLDRAVLSLIEARRRDPEDRGDLISMLLAAQEDGRGMTDRQLRDEALTIYLAGHETTANALSWTWYLLSENPETERRLHAELDTVLGGRLPTADDVPRLPYSRAVVAESMRLYPPAWAVSRLALEPCEVAGYTLPKGSIVVAAQWVTHRDPRWFPDPERFDPERWTPEAEAARPKFSYFPFGGGPRVCIGEGFAWMEGVLLLATIARRWRLRLVPGHPVATLPVVTLRPRHGMRMTLERR